LQRHEDAPKDIVSSSSTRNIFTAEQEYEFLKDDRKKYEEEIRKEQNAMLEWKRKNIPAYDVMMMMNQSGDG
jgi:hypothetical protein